MRAVCHTRRVVMEGDLMDVAFHQLSLRNVSVAANHVMTLFCFFGHCDAFNPNVLAIWFAQAVGCRYACVVGIDVGVNAFRQTFSV